MTILKSVLVAAILTVAGTQPLAAQAQPSIDGFQPIVSRLTGQCMTATDTGLRQRPCQDTPNQQWRLLPVAGTSYFWFGDRQSGTCLGTGPTLGELAQGDCASATTLRWLLLPEGSAYKIISLGGGSPWNTLEAAGDVVRLAPWQAGPHQQWAVTTATSPPAGRAWFGTEDRGTYWVGQYTIQNPDTVPLSDWVLEFDLPAGAWLGQYWNGVPTLSGTHVTVRPTPTNRTIPAAGTTTFGFTGLGTSRTPTNCKLSGQPCAGPMQVMRPPNTGAVTATQLMLYWLYSAEAVRYDVERNGSVIASVAGMQFVDTGVRPGTTYSYRVRAYAADGRVTPFSPASTVSTP